MSDRTAGLAPATVRYAHRVFSLLLTHAVRDGRLARNPAEGVRLPRVPSSKEWASFMVVHDDRLRTAPSAASGPEQLLASFSGS